MTDIEIIRAWERKKLPLNRPALEDIQRKLSEACHLASTRLDESTHQLVKERFVAELALLRKIEGTVDFMLHEVLPGTVRMAGRMPKAETTMVPDRSQLPCEHDTIECPNCGHNQVARVLDAHPQEAHAHECRQCKYTITQAEWRSLLPN